MWKTAGLMLLAGLALAACQPAVPDSAAGIPDPGRGVGFDNSLDAARAREAALARSAPIQTPIDSQPIASPAGAAGPVSPAPAQQQARAASSDPELARLNAEADARARAANSGQAVVNASPSNAAPQIINNPGISSEQDFGAVSSQRSIEGDAARIQANRQQYQVIAPTDLPSRQGAGQPNIVAFALQTTHAKGTRIYRRSGLTSDAKFRRNCAGFASDDEAQIAFLSQGGPERDRQGIDPDGDGYACAWDPAPFRRVSG